MRISDSRVDVLSQRFSCRVRVIQLTNLWLVLRIHAMSMLIYGIDLFSFRVRLLDS